MSAVDDLFQRLRREGRKALIPFLTAGDPDLEFTTAALERLERVGCSLGELGVPYSDPIADGPVIQASYTRALERHVKLGQVLDMVRRARSRVEMPLVTMVSYSIIYRHGLEAFVAEAKAAGVDGAIVPDLLVEEAQPLREICQREDFSLIQLVTPTTSRTRARRIAECSSGFLYYVSVTGVTGERDELSSQVLDNVAWLRDETQLPICIGFGISQPRHVRMLAPAADGLIVGSAFVRHVAGCAEAGRERTLDAITALAGSLIDALGS